MTQINVIKKAGPTPAFGLIYSSPISTFPSSARPSLAMNSIAFCIVSDARVALLAVAARPSTAFAAPFSPPSRSETERLNLPFRRSTRLLTTDRRSFNVKAPGMDNSMRAAQTRRSDVPLLNVTDPVRTTAPRPCRLYRRCGCAMWEATTAPVLPRAA